MTMKKALLAAVASLATGCVSISFNDTRKEEMDVITKETVSYLVKDSAELSKLYYGPVDNKISYIPVYDKKGEREGTYISVRYLFKLKAEAQGLEMSEGQPWPAKVEIAYYCSSEENKKDFSCQGPKLQVAQ